jgi:lactose/L-arabinose transport system ATP-binding protein
MSGLQLNDVIKRYGATQVIHGVDLDIEDGEFCVFVGPSGCGKSTLLRMVAGLEETTEGRIAIGGRDVTHMDPAERGVAMVFQTYALYPHMTVAENMGFGLKMTGHPKAEIEAKVARGVAEGPEARRLPRPQAQGAVGRPAPARRDRAGHRAGARGVPLR